MRTVNHVRVVNNNVNLDDEGHVNEEKPQSFELEDPDIKEGVKVMSEPIKVKHVTMMEPVETRNVHHVITAMDKILTRMQYLGVCVTRIHSDRAKELLASRFKSWVAHRNMLHSFTAGDDPQSNGHCESEVNQLKRRTRLLLHVAGQDSTHWPQAMRFATEERLRSQFESLGCPMPKMVQYQSRVLVKRKRWHDKGNLLAKPFVESRLLCPSPDMTFGWLVQTEVDQHVVHAREVIVPDPLSEQAQIELHEETNPNKPPYRLWGKQPFPGRPRPKLPEPRFDRGGEPSLDLNQVHEELDELFADAGIENPEGNPPNEVREGEMIDMKRMEKETVKKETVEKETVKKETWENVEGQLTWNHQRVMEHLRELLDVVPTSGEIGKHCGETIEWLNSQKQWLEWNLHNCKEVVNEKTIKLCGLQVNPGDDDSQGEILQTTTIPLSEVRRELGEWKEAMMKEYDSLIHETKAIEPIDISQLNQEEIELVPGKLVTVRKAGPNGGKKKCRAVVCGNLLQGDADPNPGSLYASGADGVLIREPMSKVAAIIGLAACAIGAGLTTSSRTRSGCALAAAACAGWLAGDAAAMARHRGIGEKTGKEPKLKTIGKKKGQEVRENEPTHTDEFIVRENEPTMKKPREIKKPKMENETEPTVDFEKRKKVSQSEGIDDNPQKMNDHKGCEEEDPQSLELGCFQSRGEVRASGEACHDTVEAQHNQVVESNQIARQCEAVSQYHCPTGCPVVPVKTRVKAMTLRHGPTAGKSGATGYDASQGSASTSWLEGNGPWCLPRFLVKPPSKAQDQWSYLEHEGKQYWIKTHHGPRERLFHPVHRSQPMEVQQLKDYRVTLMFPLEGKGNMMKRIDKWMDQHRVTGEKWVGYTFFEMKAKYQVDDQAGTTPWVPESATSKGCSGKDFNKGKNYGGKQTVVEGPLVSIYVNQPMGSATERYGAGSGEGQEQEDQWPVTTGANEWGIASDGWSMVSEMNEQ